MAFTGAPRPIQPQAMENKITHDAAKLVLETKAVENKPAVENKAVENKPAVENKAPKKTKAVKSNVKKKFSEKYVDLFSDKFKPIVSVRPKTIADHFTDAIKSSSDMRASSIAAINNGHSLRAILVATIELFKTEIPNAKDCSVSKMRSVWIALGLPTKKSKGE
jgi:hypothetical protein